MKYRLKVDDARKRDVGRQIARIPVKIADRLGLRTGDIVKITGKRTTYAKVWRSNIPEISDDSIKLDALTRRNLQVNLDDQVDIEAGKATIAKSVKVQPIQSVSVTNNLIPYLTKSLMDKIMVSDDVISLSTGFGGSIYFYIGETNPKGPILFNEKTELILQHGDLIAEIDEKSIPDISYESVGGLSDAVRKIREMIELPLRYPEIFEHLGIQPPKGVLLYGPPGTGKTLLAKAIASETSSSFYIISGPEITSRYYGESEGKIREIFEKAKQTAPAIIFIDEIDSIVPKRDDTGGEVERRIVAQLLSLMDGVTSRGNVVVIGATNRINSIDEALRRGGRFDREIEIGIPDTDSRLEILQIHTRGMPLAEDVDLGQLSNRTHGFVGADLETLTKEAALRSLGRSLPDLKFNKDLSKVDLTSLGNLRILMADFEQALTEVSPSAMREVYVELPNVRWDDIGGHEDIKETMKEVIEWPLKYHKVFDTMKMQNSRGILLFGPPGNGKTMLVKAVANESDVNFISIKGPELLSKWVGESEKGVREVFRKARAAAPCIIFFDEFDSIASIRDSSTSEVIQRVVSQLLTEIDGLVEVRGLILIAATNRPDLIDPALLRPGRFDKVIFVSNPDQKSRELIIKIYLKGVKMAADINTEEIVNRTEGYSGAELHAIITEAKMIAIKQFLDKNTESFEEKLDELMLEGSHLEKALQASLAGTKKPYTYKPTGLSEMRDIGFA